MAKVTILLETKTRDEMEAIGRKDQTYDQLILEHPWCQVQHKHQNLHVQIWDPHSYLENLVMIRLQELVMI
jgi:hypothetical protein